MKLRIVFVIGVITLAAMIDKSTCASRWENSGIRSKWGLLQGCLVEVKPNTWIPEVTYRSVN